VAVPTAPAPRTTVVIACLSREIELFILDPSWTIKLTGYELGGRRIWVPDAVEKIIRP
jgi:hypothetical protein